MQILCDLKLSRESTQITKYKLIGTCISPKTVYFEIIKALEKKFVL